MRTPVSLLILLIFFVLMMGCTGNQDTGHQMPTPKPTIESSTIQTNTPAVNILSPALEIELFKNRYNNRDLNGLLEIFSGEIKAEHPIKDFKKELEFAENFSIKIVDWNVSNATINENHPGVEKRTMDVMLSIRWDENSGNLSFRLPMVCDDDCLIDGWIFEFLHRYVKTEYCLSLNLSSNISKGCWEIIAKKALQIAMNDSKVRWSIGTDYKIIDVGISSLLNGSVGHYVTYPVVVVDEKEATDYIFVDVKNETVVHIGTVYKLPVPPEEPN